MKLLIILLLLLSHPLAHAAKPSSVYPPLTSELFLRVMLCESNNTVCVAGDDGTSSGTVQFTKETFYRLGKLARKSLIRRKLLGKHEALNWLNTGHQLMVAHWAMRHGWGHEWTCYRNLTGVGRPKSTTKGKAK